MLVNSPARFRLFPARCTCLVVAGCAAAFAQASTAPVAGLKSADVEVRREAAEALGKLGGTAADAVPALISALKDEEVRVRANAAWALGKIQQHPEPSIAALVGALSDSDWTVRHNAELSLKWFGAAAVPALQKALRSSAPVVQVYAASVLQQIEPGKPDAILPTLVRLLDGKDEGISHVAIQVLGSIGAPAADAVPKLIPLLESKTPMLKGSAAFALGEIGPAAKPALAGLVKLTAANNKSDLRVAAAEALAKIDGPPDQWVPAVILMFQPTHEESVQAAGVRALFKLGQPAVPFLVAATRDENEVVRGLAVDTLAQIGPGATSAVPAVVERLGDPHWEVRRRAAHALQQIGVTNEAVMSALKAATADPNEWVQASAKTALARLSSPQS